MRRVVLWCAVVGSTLLTMFSLLFTVVAWFSMGGADLVLPGFLVTALGIAAIIATARALRHPQRAA